MSYIVEYSPADESEETESNHSDGAHTADA